jgi:hypothetical protein
MIPCIVIYLLPYTRFKAFAFRRIASASSRS